MNTIEIIKKAYALVFGFISSVLFYFLPIRDLVLLLFCLFVVSYLIGIVHSVRFDLEDISKTKTFRAIKEFTIYTALIACFFIIGERMHADGVMLKIIETITWGLIYIYTTNIFKNLVRLFPYAKGVRWIYFVLNLEFIKRFPELGEFNEKEKEENKDETTA